MFVCVIVCLSVCVCVAFHYHWASVEVEHSCINPWLTAHSSGPDYTCVCLSWFLCSLPPLENTSSTHHRGRGGFKQHAGLWINLHIHTHCHPELHKPPSEEVWSLNLNSTPKYTHLHTRILTQTCMLPQRTIDTSQSCSSLLRSFSPKCACITPLSNQFNLAKRNRLSSIYGLQWNASWTKAQSLSDLDSDNNDNLCWVSIHFTSCLFRSL